MTEDRNRPLGPRRTIAAIDNGPAASKIDAAALRIARLRELEALRDELTERLGQAPADVPDILPNVAVIRGRKVGRLADALRRPEKRDEAAEAIRGVMERITLKPGQRRGEIDATLHGELGTILKWTARTGRKNKTYIPTGGVSVSVVVQAGSEPAAFRLPAGRPRPAPGRGTPSASCRWRCGTAC